MPDSPAKPRPAEREGEGESASTDADADADANSDNDRPTVSPPFDPIAFARDILKPSAPPFDAHTKQTPPGGIAAAQHQIATTPPGGAVPKSAISLANALAPSKPPARVPIKNELQRLESVSNMNALDREWADMEIATRPPPADGPGEDPVIEVQNHPPLDLDDVELVDEHAADTVRRPITQEEVKPREREMTDRVSLGDYSGALEIAERILADNPDDAGAKACAESCRTVLRQMYATRIGPLDRVPVVMVPRDQLRWLSIDHKAGFVLSLVDGVSSLEMIIDVSGMPELDTLRILSELAQQRIISLR